MFLWSARGHVTMRVWSRQPEAYMLVGPCLQREVQASVVYCASQYPDAWGADASTDSWFYENYIGDRARLAQSVVSVRSCDERNVAAEGCPRRLRSRPFDHEARPQLSACMLPLEHPRTVCKRGDELPGQSVYAPLQTGKPIIMEECGTQTFYGNRDHVCTSLHVPLP